MSKFKLDQRLEDNSFLIDIFEDIQIRVFNDSRYFWYILVPIIFELKDWHDLPIKVEKNLLIYTRKLSQFLSQTQNADKINIASIGNIVSQFHLHVIARHKDDAKWPQPVWGDPITSALSQNDLEIRKYLIKMIKTLVIEEKTD